MALSIPNKTLKSMSLRSPGTGAFSLMKAFGKTKSPGARSGCTPVSEKQAELEISSSALPSDSPYANLSRSSNRSSNGVSTDEVTGLYVRKVPHDMRNDELSNIFKQHGNVLSVYIKRQDISHYDFTFAIVKVGSRREALKIIENLNGKRPFEFRIEIALTEEERNKRKGIIEKNNLESDQVYAELERQNELKKSIVDSIPKPEISKSPSSGIGRGSVLKSSIEKQSMHRLGAADAQTNGICSEYSTSKKSEDLLERPLSTVIESIEKTDPVPSATPSIAETSTAFSSTVKTKLSESNATEIDSIAAMRKSDFPTFTKSSSLPANCAEKSSEETPRTCVRCTSQCNKRCSVCKAAYCSTDCQMDDWFFHSHYCRPPPPLEECSFFARQKRKAYNEPKNEGNVGTPQTAIGRESNEASSVCCKASPQVMDINLGDAPVDIAQIPAKSLMEKEVTPEVIDYATAKSQSKIQSIDTTADLSSTPKKQSDCLKIGSVFDELEHGSDNTGIVTKMNSVQCFTMLLFAEETSYLINEGINLVDKLPKVEGFNPSIGDFVSSESPSDETLCRSYVFDKQGDEFAVFQIDFGYSEIVRNVKPLPPGKCSEVSAHGVNCLLRKTEKSKEDQLAKIIQSDQLIAFKVDKKDCENTIHILDDFGESIAVYSVLPWYKCIPESFNEVDNHSLPDIKPDEETETTVENTKSSSVEIVKCSELSGFPLEIGDTYNMLAVWHKEDNLFLQHDTNELLELFREMMAGFSEYCSNAPVIDSVSLDQVVCVYSDNLWHRAVVISSDSSHVDVILIDIGREKRVGIDKIRSMDVQFLELPHMCVKVKLVHPKDTQKSISGISSNLSKLCEGSAQLEMIVVSCLDDGECKENFRLPEYSVLLSTASSCINEDLCASKEEPQTPVEPLQLPSDTQDLIKGIDMTPLNYTYSECKALDIPPGDAVELVVLDVSNTHTIMVLPKDKLHLMEDLETLSAKFNEYCNNQQAVYYRPMEGEIVLVKFSQDGLWYRAACLSLTEHSAMVFFVDYGNMENALFECIVRAVEGFVSPVPFLAVHCALQGTTSPSSDACNERLKELLPAFQPITADKVSPQDSDTLLQTLTINNVLDVLKKENLL